MTELCLERQICSQSGKTLQGGRGELGGSQNLAGSDPRVTVEADGNGRMWENEEASGRYQGPVR